LPEQLKVFLRSNSDYTFK